MIRFPVTVLAGVLGLIVDVFGFTGAQKWQ